MELACKLQAWLLYKTYHLWWGYLGDNCSECYGYYGNHVNIHNSIDSTCNNSSNAKSGILKQENGKE